MFAGLFWVGAYCWAARVYGGVGFVVVLGIARADDFVEALRWSVGPAVEGMGAG